jgi:hypothetical protein
MRAPQSFWQTLKKKKGFYGIVKSLERSESLHRQQQLNSDSENGEKKTSDSFCGKICPREWWQRWLADWVPEKRSELSIDGLTNSSFEVNQCKWGVPPFPTLCQQEFLLL